MVLHSSQDASFQHPLNVGMIFLGNVECLDLQKFKVGAKGFMDKHTVLNFSVTLFSSVFCIDFIKFSSTYFPFPYRNFFLTAALGYIAYSSLVWVAVWR